MTKQKNDDSELELLILTHSSELSGGGETSLLEMLTYLKSKNINTHVICPYEGDFSKALQKLKIPISIIPQPWWVLGKTDKGDFQFTNGALGQNVTRQIVDLINNLQPKRCMTNTMAIPWLAYAAAICSKQHIWLIHEAGLDFKYSIDREEILRTIDGLSEKVFFNSKYTANMFTSIFKYNTTPDIIHPSSKLKTPDPNTPSPFKGDRNRFISTGTVIRRKRAIDAITAIKILKDKGIKAELALVGGEIDDDYSQELRKYCKENNITDSIHFLGAQDNPTSYIQHADIVLMCSEAEAFGLVTVESMAVGKPVIGTSDAGTPEIVTDGKNGLLYELHNVKELAEKMEYLINNPDLVKKFGDFAKKDVRNRFSPEKNYKPLLDYLATAPTIRKSVNLTPLYSVIDDYKRLDQERINVTNHRDKLVKRLENADKTLGDKATHNAKRVVNLSRRGLRFSKRVARKIVNKLGS